VNPFKNACHICALLWVAVLKRYIDALFASFYFSGNEHHPEAAELQNQIARQDTLAGLAAHPIRCQ